MRRVHIVDAAAEIGGILRWIPRLPGLGQWARILDYRKIQLEKQSNVEIILNTGLAAEDIADYGAEIVVLATGASWARDGTSYISGAIAGIDADLPWVITPDQLMAEAKPVPGERVVVYDGEGFVVGSGIAMLLRDQGYDIKLVTPFSVVAPQAD